MAWLAIHVGLVTGVLQLVVGMTWLNYAQAGETLPREVSSFIEQRTLCDHFRQEPWPEGNSLEEQERRALLAAGRERYCTGMDATLRNLRERYRTRPEVLQQLKDFDASVE